jgi:hypothetical protein
LKEQTFNPDLSGFFFARKKSARGASLRELPIDRASELVLDGPVSNATILVENAG